MNAAAALTYNGLQGHLATITSQAEFDFIVSTLNINVNTWIGVSDSEVEGTYRFVAGPEAGQAISSSLYSNFWYPGEPSNNVDENCAHFNQAKKLNDINCGWGFLYLIEYEAGTLCVNK